MSSSFNDLSKNLLYQKTTPKGLIQAINHQGHGREVSR
jgi:hypothetical protein